MNIDNLDEAEALIDKLRVVQDAKATLVGIMGEDGGDGNVTDGSETAIFGKPNLFSCFTSSDFVTIAC